MELGCRLGKYQSVQELAGDGLAGNGHMERKEGTWNGSGKKQGLKSLLSLDFVL